MQRNRQVPDPSPYLWIPTTAEPVSNTRATDCRMQSCGASFQSFISITIGKMMRSLCARFGIQECKPSSFSPRLPPSYFRSIYSSDEDDDDIEMCDHDYDGLLPKSGKRHLGKTRWTREEVTNKSLYQNMSRTQCVAFMKHKISAKSQVPKLLSKLSEILSQPARAAGSPLTTLPHVHSQALSSSLNVLFFPLSNSSALLSTCRRLNL